MVRKLLVSAVSAAVVGAVSVFAAEANLIPSDLTDWNASVGAQGVRTQWPEEAKEIESHVREFLSADVRAGNAGLVVTFDGSDGINRYRDKCGMPHVWSRIICRKRIPVDSSKKYVLSFRDTGKVSDCRGRNRPFFTVRFFGKANRTLDTKYCEFYPQPSGVEYRTEVYPPSGTVELGVSFDICGVAKMTIDRVSLVAAERETGFDILLHPMCCFDNAFHLSEGQVGGLSFAPLNKSELKPKAPYLRVTLPKGFEAVGFRRGYPAKEILPATQDGSRTYEVKMMGFNGWYGEPHPNARAYMLVKSAFPASEAAYEASYQAFDGDYATPRRVFQLKVDKAVKGRRPKKFMSSVQICEAEYSEAPFRKLADVYEATGFNWIYIHPWSKWQSAEIARRGILRFGAGCGGNGYWLWDEKDDKRPDDTRFVGVDGKTLHPYMACPASVYNRTPWYREHFMSSRAKRLCEEDAFDYYIANWEPMGMLDTGGCYCENCKRDFIAFSKLPKEKVDEVWPKGVVERYRQTYFRFKSYQHGRYVATLEEDLRKAGETVGKNSGLCVEITSGHMVDDENVLSGRDNAFDVKWYADKVQWIDPWGPYIFTSCENPHRTPPGDHVRLLRRSREVTRYLDKILPNRAKHPKLLGFPNGYIRDTGWTPPEELTLDILTYYAAGWQGSQTYYFLGLDNRYWQAHATANDVIARTEDVVMDGEHLPVGSTKVAAVSPYPPSVYQTPILDTETYRKGETLLVAVCNFWQYGEVFYTLTVPQADRTKTYAVTDEATGDSYAHTKTTLFTGEDLARGILLSTPRLAWSFFRLTPAAEGAANAITPEDLERRLAGRRAALQKLCDADLAYLKATQAPPERKTDCSMLEPIENAGISAALETVKGETFVSVKSAESVWRIDPNRGAKIAGWTFGGAELAFPDNPRFGLAEDGLWVPGSRMNKAMDLKSVEKTKDGLALSFVRELNANDAPCVKGVVHTKTLAFTKAGVRLTTDLHNVSGDEVKFAFRSFNTLGLLRAGEDHPSGRATLAGTNGPLEFRRTFVPRYYRMSGVAEDREIRHNFMTRDDGLLKAEIREPSATFFSHDGRVALTLRLAPSSLFHGFAVCDFSTLEAPTFEPIFNNLTIPTGQRFTATVEFIAERKP